ncbi:single-stranded DNA-binding protein [Romboutsia lituseburensis]|uniref:single-stranded DNA-binding protein n=1 Tax=Romboutsia lituseburensis TaxID=1537 RepID=UPI00215A44D4|nr:single-stranded DNA-binding protein [Romboutsia lituseburensis]MCR8744352.1 single-stranded DNA-binding protein [Romboutsia lituseburensis]
MNQVILIGRLTRDVELKYIQGRGMAVAQFAIAVEREFTGKDGKKETDFIDIQVWGKSAENCANYICKGSLIAVNGAIRIETYKNKDGENRKTTKINTSRVQFLDSRNKTNNQEPQFEPQGALDPNGWDAINDNDIPF